jgi:hypothetical protein
MKRIAILLAFTFAALAQPPDCPNNPNPAAYKCVTYQVEGSFRQASVHILNESGGTEQNRVRLPWIMQFVAPRGQQLGIDVFTVPGGGYGRFSAVVYVNGKAIQSASSTDESPHVHVGGFVQ